MMSRVSTWLICVAVGLLVTTRLAAEEDGSSWPQYSGPQGLFTSEYDGKLIDQLGELRVVWQSEFDGLGIAKRGAFARKQIGSLPEEKQFVGGWSSMIVAEGVVFVPFRKPAGKPGPEPKHGTLPKAMQFIRADDGMVAMDATTGKTKWLTVHAKEGINYVPDKRGGWGVTPVYIDGIVVSLGTGGILSGYDAKTGQRIWKRELPNCYDHLQRMVRDLEASERYAGRIHKQANLIIANSLAIVPDQFGGLSAVEPKTGALAWSLIPEKSKPKFVGPYCTPAEWNHEGTSYLLSQGDDVLSLIETTTGNVLWRRTDLGPSLESVYVFAGDTVLVNTRASERSERKPGRYGALKLSLTDPKIIWKLPDEQRYDYEWKLDRGATRVTLDGGKVIYIWQKSKGPGYLMAVETATGQIVWEQDAPLARNEVPLGNQVCPVRVGNRVLVFTDWMHSPRPVGLVLMSVQENRLQLLDINHEWPTEHQSAGGYEVPAIYAVAAGRMYVRSFDGHIICYDLRAE